MASGRDQLQFILNQLSGLDEITYRPMMGEFVLYYRGKIVGGIYDDRLLVKPVRAAVEYVKSPVYAVPYDRAKEMLLIEDIDDRGYLANLFRVIYNELPTSKKTLDVI